ncbi:unnamed protein product, partial [Ectocarpus sp. 12 AP-2014]
LSPVSLLPLKSRYVMPLRSPSFSGIGPAQEGSKGGQTREPNFLRYVSLPHAASSHTCYQSLQVSQNTELVPVSDPSLASLTDVSCCRWIPCVNLTAARQTR